MSSSLTGLQILALYEARAGAVIEAITHGKPAQIRALVSPGMLATRLLEVTLDVDRDAVHFLATVERWPAGDKKHRIAGFDLVPVGVEARVGGLVYFGRARILATSCPRRAVMKIEIINPTTQQPYPSTVASGRTFYLVEAGQEFYVRVSSSRYIPGRRQEYVVAVDGRDTLTNEDATLERSGIVVDGPHYLCMGFRVSASDIRTFTAVRLGQGATTAERNGTANMAGLVFAACYSERSRIQARNVYDGGGYRGGGVMRGDITRGVHADAAGEDEPLSFGVGAAAGRQQASHVGQTQWNRDASTCISDAVEYGDRASLAARGIVFPQLNPNWPLRQAFANPATL